MLKINEDYECERDTYGWKLHRWRDGKDKDGNPKRTCRTTYHGTLVQVCNAVIDDAAGGAESARQLRSIVGVAKADLKKALSPNAEAQGRRSAAGAEGTLPASG